MKTTLTLAALIAVSFAAANAAHAQTFRVGPVAVDLGGFSGSYDHTTYHDHGYRADYDHSYNDYRDRPQVADPFSRRKPSSRRPIYDRPSRLDNLSYDPATGRWVANTSSETVYNSATDPNRDVVDRGSMRTRTLSTVDAQGNEVNKTITSWTSYGVPHSNTTTQIVRRAGDLTVVDDHHVLRSVNPNAGDQE